MKKNLIILLIIMIAFVAGCESNSKEKIVSNGETVNTSKMGHKHCTREATANAGVDVDLNYDLYYKGNILNLLKAEEKIMSADSSTLDTYEEAYKAIQKRYEGLQYYDGTVKRTDTTVVNTTVINYEKINIEQLLQIEGEEDNIIENGQAKLDKWLELAKKFGTKCEEVED